MDATTGELPWIRIPIHPHSYNGSRRSFRISAAARPGRKNRMPGRCWSARLRTWKTLVDRIAVKENPRDRSRWGAKPKAAIGQDAGGELYAITGSFAPTGLEGRIWQNMQARTMGHRIRK